ncbi:MAG: hypothetical protein IPO34_21210 [Dehalococcoidia bacterium]|nr:hypothetical protein [Dehalococcoidia bacterium]
MGEGDDPSHWNYWQREPLIYQSGLLDALPAGMAAPRCYGSVPLPGNFALLWLEDIHDAYQTAWPLARYALAARRLGGLNGRYASGGARQSFPLVRPANQPPMGSLCPTGATFLGGSARKK